MILEFGDEETLRLERGQNDRLQRVVNEINNHLPLVIEVMELQDHPESENAFSVSLDTDKLPDLSLFAGKLESIFKLLATDHGFTMALSGGFILVVPEGPYSHLCATFAIYMADKHIRLVKGEESENVRSVLGTSGDVPEDKIEEYISGWAESKLANEWQWFEEASKEVLPGYNWNETKVKIQKALPLLVELLEDGRCYIEPPTNSESDDPDVSFAWSRVLGTIKEALHLAPHASRAIDVGERIKELISG